MSMQAPGFFLTSIILPSVVALKIVSLATFGDMARGRCQFPG